MTDMDAIMVINKGTRSARGSSDFRRGHPMAIEAASGHHGKNIIAVNPSTPGCPKAKAAMRIARLESAMLPTALAYILVLL